MGLFNWGKKKEVKPTGPTSKASERIIMQQIEDQDEEAAELVDQMKAGSPLVINLDKLDLMAANKLLAFLSGATYAIGGKYVKINEATYLFARSEDFQDGTLDEFLEDLDEE